MVNTRTLEQMLDLSGRAAQDSGARRDLVRRGLLATGGEAAQAAPALAPQRGAQMGRSARRQQDILDNWAMLDFATRAEARAVRSHDATISQLARDPQIAGAFDVLRTQLLQAMAANGWTTIGVTSPTHGCGGTFVASALAASCARREDLRAILLDLDLQRPTLHEAFDLEPMGSVADMLAGRLPMEAHLQRLTRSFAIGMSDAPFTSPVGVLQSDTAQSVMSEIRTQLAPDIIICDLPPLLSGDAAIAMLPQLDGVLLVTDGTQTSPRDITDCERLIAGKTQLMGVILNKSDDRDFERFNPRG
ncbi:CpsD/CapB family tyrosine-protein kinase [Roseicitreum antarcticum]|uniref:Chromosome partitioning ATPase, Mrp family, contains Fe-S cluster n=1 Tax=Roseicitreum antarcticum TaxID=564137 RepID=A0A1H2S010_9RHOB|nr:CpsD/CapB family tyrosine-protein kinase [Roseicitreum antarcticum]SDW24239.1 Chromosome partitioning ATPase, Mrp family, contains Fe-S cluster [Roseicitreum antarcticum]